MKHIKYLSLFVLIFGVVLMATEERPRVREFGIKIGIMEPGKWNAITDVMGVKVGHVTLIEGKSVRTGATAILPHDGNIYQEMVPGAIYVANGYGKLMGYTQCCKWSDHIHTCTTWQR